MKSGILLSKAKLQWINEVIFSKEIVNSVCCTLGSFSNIFSILDNSEIGRSFEKSNLESFLYTGTTLATFSIVGKTPVENEMLNISAN